MPCHSYLFFDALPSLAGVAGATRAKWHEEFAACAASVKAVTTEAYTTLGLKAGSRLMLHVNATSPEEVHEFAHSLLATPLGGHLAITYTLLGLTRASPYNPGKAAAPHAPNTPHRYLIVYPFTKTIEWHLLPYEERRRVMQGHVETAKAHSRGISQLLLHSYGIDDHEFVVSYYCDSLEDFQTLVMALRSTEARRYTLRDTPIFTCIHLPLKEALRAL